MWCGGVEAEDADDGVLETVEFQFVARNKSGPGYLPDRSITLANLSFQSVALARFQLMAFAPSL